MKKWPLTLLVLVALVQVQHALSGSVGQATVLDPKLAAVEERVQQRLQEAKSGQSNLNTILIIGQHAKKQANKTVMRHRTSLTCCHDGLAFMLHNVQHYWSCFAA